MDAISGTRRAMKEMADGTIRVQIDIDPACRADFLRLFPNIDMPVGLAPLVANFERTSAIQPAQNKPKGGDLARLAGQLCESSEFRQWLAVTFEATDPAAFVREACGVTSRAYIDHDPKAAELFHERVRKPFRDWVGA